MYSSAKDTCFRTERTFGCSTYWYSARPSLLAKARLLRWFDGLKSVPSGKISSVVGRLRHTRYSLISRTLSKSLDLSLFRNTNRSICWHVRGELIYAFSSFLLDGRKLSTYVRGVTNTYHARNNVIGTLSELRKMFAGDLLPIAIPKDSQTLRRSSGSSRFVSPKTILSRFYLPLLPRVEAIGCGPLAGRTYAR